MKEDNREKDMAGGAAGPDRIGNVLRRYLAAGLSGGAFQEEQEKEEVEV